MKKRMLVSVLILLFVVIGWKTLMDTERAVEEQYSVAISSARQYAEQGIYYDSIEAYKEAIAIRDSMDLRIEYIGVLEAAYGTEACKQEYIDLMNYYPHEPQGYYKYCLYALERKNMSEFFEVVDNAQKYGAMSEELEQLREEHWYDYKFGISSYVKLEPYSGGLAKVYDSNGLIGYVDEYGDQVGEVKYINASQFLDFGIVTDETGETYLVDSRNEKRRNDNNKLKYTDYTVYSNDMFAVCCDGQYYYVDDHFNIKDEGKRYLNATAMNGGYAAVKTEAGWQFINENQEIICSTAFDDVVKDEMKIAVRYGVALAKQGDNYYFVNVDGTKVSETSYEDVKMFYLDCIAAVKKNEKWGYVNTKGEAVTDFIYDDARSFRNGLAAVKVGGLWGFIDTTGKMVIEPAFLEAYEINGSGRIPVRTENGWKLINIYSYSY